MKFHALTLALFAAACATTAPATTSPTPQQQTPRQTAVAPAQRVTPAESKVNTRAALLFEDTVKLQASETPNKPVDRAALVAGFRAAQDADSKLAEASFNLGVLAQESGNLNEAVRQYRAALAAQPNYSPAAASLALIGFTSGREAEAVQMLEQFVKANPDDAVGRAYLAELYRRQGRNDPALAMAKEALLRDPKTLPAYKVMLNISYEQKKFALARLISLRALKLDPKDPEVLHVQGLMYLAENDLPSAKAQFQKAVEARPNYLPSRQGLASIAFAQEDYASAEENLRPLLQAGATPSMLVDLGVAYSGLGQLDKANQAYDEALKMDPKLVEPLFNKGVIALRQKAPDKALSLFNQYIAKRGGDRAIPVNDPVRTQVELAQKAMMKNVEAQRVEQEAQRMEQEAAAKERAEKEQELRRQQGAAKQNPVPVPPPPANQRPAPGKR